MSYNWAREELIYTAHFCACHRSYSSQYVRTQDGRHKDFEAEDKAEAAAAKSEGAMEVA